MSHIGAGAAVLVVTFTFFARGWIGGGDAKLAAATALWLGFDQLMNYLLYASLFGGVLTLFVIRFRVMPLPAALAGQDWVKRLHRADAGVPYGIALAASALLVYPDTFWMQALRNRAECRPPRTRSAINPKLTQVSIRLINHELTFG